jgi:hypothetical protein
MNDNVITIPKDNWTTLLLLKSSINYLKTKDIRKYDKTIRKEERMFKEILNESYH